VPFLELGIAQDPMLHATPPDWAHFLPGYGGFRVLTNAILTHTFQAGPLLTALVWLAEPPSPLAWCSATTCGRPAARPAQALSRNSPH
jgi:hypothetical protein